MAFGLLSMTLSVASPRTTELKRSFVTATRIVDTKGEVENVSYLLSPGRGQSVLGRGPCCSMKKTAGEETYVLLDFGRETHGGIQIVTGQYPSGKPVKVRIRFGESVGEACCDIDGENGATNDHATRDFEATLPWLGVYEYGNTGFRFVRIDLVDAGTELLLKEVSAISQMRELEYVGSFHSQDQRLDSIWQTAAYTVHLNMQDYIWDGIKRDRLVWIGDLLPEVMTVCNVFGEQEVIPKSLDLVRDETPLPGWMHGMGTYSIWWILIHDEWYKYNGNLEYLKRQKAYMSELLRHLMTFVDAKGRERLDSRFLDWPSMADSKAMDAGIHAIMMMAMSNGAKLLRIMGDSVLASECDAVYGRLKSAAPLVVSEFYSEQVPFTSPGRKQAVALMRMADMIIGPEVSRRLLEGGGRGFSTFYGCYMLEALALEGKYAEALDIIKEYWGGMLDLGATSFWEDFDLSWMENAGRIDEIVPEGKVDVHRSYGGYCYKGYRHSLCHGWASGPASWLIRHIAGLQPVEPGCKTVMVDPHLAGLGEIEASMPTPYGPVRVKAVQDGTKVIAYVSAPNAVHIKAGKGVKLMKLK